MNLNNVEIPQKIIRYLPPIAIIDNAGVIVWSNKDELPVGQNLSECFSDLNLSDIIGKDFWTYVSFKECTYDLYSHPTEDGQGAVVLLEPVETKTLMGLIDSPYEGFVFVDKNGKIRLVNETVSHYMTLPKKQMIGKHFDEFKIDSNFHRIIETKQPDLLMFFETLGKNGIASRHPVFTEGKFIGVYGRYLSIDGHDLQEKTFGEEYSNLLEGIKVRNIAQAIMELNMYRNEFLSGNKPQFDINSIIGSSHVMKEIKQRILMVADSPSVILLTGETGTGKEIFAAAIHSHSERSKYPFVKVNCAAIPENLLESELFGYIEGAFTGALKGGKAGKFELADKGVIFLDEIGDMPLAMQAKLLRVLQEDEVERLGSGKTIPIDVRVIAATNKDLIAMVRSGTFRSDLFYRLNVINLHIPPLRDRIEDIPELVDHFIEYLNKKLNRRIKGVAPEAMQLLAHYDWPGNVRELINMLEASMNFCYDKYLGIKDLPNFFLSNYTSKKLAEDLQSTIDEAQKSEVVAALQKSNGKKREAAAILGISKSTLYRLMKKYGLIEN